MRNINLFLFAIGKLSLIALITFSFNCSKNSGTGGGGSSNQAPKVTILNVTPSGILYDGRLDPATRSTVDFSVTGTSPITTKVNGAPTTQSYHTTDTLLSTTRVVVTGSNAYGSDEKEATITVTMTQQVAFLWGVWAFESGEVQAPTLEWQPFYMPPHLADNITRFKPYGRWIDYNNLDTFQVDGTAKWNFFSSNGELYLQGWGNTKRIDSLSQNRIHFFYISAFGVPTKLRYIKLY